MQGADSGAVAFGWPGIEPRWTSSSKDGVGTAYADASRVWFTISHGILNEVYYPTLDRPQIRDLQFLVTDGETFFHEEKRDLDKRHHRARRGDARLPRGRRATPPAATGS